MNTLHAADTKVDLPVDVEQDWLQQFRRLIRQKGVSLASITSIIQKNFLMFMVVCYLTAALFPALGQWLNGISFAKIAAGEGRAISISVPLLMLCGLLFNAGLGIKLKEVARIIRRPSVIVLALALNIIIPLLVTAAAGASLQFWHSSEELQNLLVGFALVIAMPIAGSSIAFTQSANGNVTLSLGLIFLSSLLSPIITPIVLNLCGNATNAHYSFDLRELAMQGTNSFMLLTVVLPSALGIAINTILGDAKTAKLKQYTKLSNLVLILLLSYVNASACLRNAFTTFDVDFFILIESFSLVVSVTAFATGWLAAKWLKTDKADEASLMFSIGMDNNSAGMVLAASALSEHPAVMAPIIFFSITQQIMAAVVSSIFFKARTQEINQTNLSVA